MPDPILTADEAATIALERYGDGWIAQDGEACRGVFDWFFYPRKPRVWEWEFQWQEGGTPIRIGPGHPNPGHWRSTAQRIERKRDV